MTLAVIGFWHLVGGWVAIFAVIAVAYYGGCWYEEYKEQAEQDRRFSREQAYRDRHSRATVERQRETLREAVALRTARLKQVTKSTTAKVLTTLKVKKVSTVSSCPFCRDEVEGEFSCPACNSEAHFECIDELGGGSCATLGCGHRPSALTRS